MGRKELELIQAAWALETEDDAWMSVVHGATDALLSTWGASGGTLLWRYGFRDDGAVEFSSMRHESPEVAAVDVEMLDILAGNPEQETMARFYRSGPAFGTTDEQLRKEPPAAREYILARAAPYGYRDSFGYIAGDSRGGLAANTISSSVIAIEAEHRDRGLAITSHLSAAYRLRTRLANQSISPDRADAVLDADGELLHQQSSGAATMRERLRAAAIDQIRATDGKCEPARLHEAWRALVEGRWTLVDYHEARGRRLLLVYENPNHFANPRALTKSELDVVALCSERRSSCCRR